MHAQGLICVEAHTYRVSVLANQVPSAVGPPTPINYANDLDIASDHTVYFTDCSAIPPAINAQGFYDTMRCVV